MTWFQFPTSNEGWKLDAVGLLAVVGESTMEECRESVTSSRICLLPRLIPAPQALVKPKRVAALPSEPAVVCAIHSGVLSQRLGFFANLIHRIDELSPYTFHLVQVAHSEARQRAQTLVAERRRTGEGMIELENIPPRNRFRRKNASQSTGIDLPPNVEPRYWSPINLVGVASFLGTIGLLVWSALLADGEAFIAVILLAITSSLLGLANLWTPATKSPTSAISHVPSGDLVIRGRQGAIIVVRCNESVARELYTGDVDAVTRACKAGWRFGLLGGISTVLFIAAIIFLGNATWTMQAALAVAYGGLHAIYWGVALLPRNFHWNFSSYDIQFLEIDSGTEVDPNDGSRPSYTRTLWKAIRATKQVAWVKKSSAVPNTEAWMRWLAAAEAHAQAGEYDWNFRATLDQYLFSTEAMQTAPAPQVVPVMAALPDRE